MFVCLFVTGTVKRLEGQEAQGAKHEGEIDEKDARHAENQAALEESKTLNTLNEEAAELTAAQQTVCS